MYDEWQHIALSEKHVHNRSRKGSKLHTSNSNNVDVTKLFGTYTISCPSAAKLGSNNAGSKYEGHLEIYCLDEERNALLAELVLPNVLHARNVVLAGSRKVLGEVIEGLQGSDDENEEQYDQKGDESAEVADADTDADADAFEEDPARLRGSRSNTFEKNSFRIFKFWVRYQGELLNADLTSNAGDTIEDSAYWIWPGSHTDHLEGTISCAQLGWENVKIKGWKKKSSNTRDYQVTWEKN